MPDLVCLCCHTSTPAPALTCPACGEASWAPVAAPVAPATVEPPAPQRPAQPPAQQQGKRRPY